MPVKTKPSDEQTRFTHALRKVLQISKEDLKVAEEQYQRERAKHPRPGPRPGSTRTNPSSSARVSSGKD
jgi:hypothetical protein